MLLNSVIIILREVLEASLIISVFLAFSHQNQYFRLWLLWALFPGLLGAAVYATQIELISQWREGVGQEVTNASLHLALAGCLLLFFLSQLFIASSTLRKKINICCLFCSTVLAINREGAEILLYLSGFMALPDHLSTVLIGSTIGSGIGLSIGILFYYVLIHLSRPIFLPTTLGIIVLILSGMVMQATQQMIQADILPYQAPVWDSSGWLPESSIPGQLLYALMGYEATPTPLQFIFYSSSILLCLGLYSINLLKKTHAIPKG